MHSFSYNDKNLSHVQQLSIYQIFRIQFFVFSAPNNKKKLLYKIMIFLMPWVFFLSFKICFFFTWKFMSEISHLRSDRKHRLSAYRINDRTGSRIITFPSYPDCVGQHYSGKYIFLGGRGISWFCLNSTHTAAVIGKKGFF